MSLATRQPGKRRSENKAPGRLAISGVIVLLCAVGFVAFGVRSVTGVPGVSYHKLYADIPDISNLRPHDEVRIAGVRVGQVLAQKVVNGRARIEIQLQPSIGRVRSDSQIVVRARGLLGSRYLELLPGRSGQLLADGSTLHAPPVTSLTNGVADVLDTFDAQTRGRFGDMVGELGQGVAARGAQLNDLIRVGPDVADQLKLVADDIEARNGAARRLVPALRSGTAALDGARDDIARFFGPAADGLAPFTQARAATQATLQQAPPTLVAMRSGLGAGQRLLVSTHALADALNRTLPKAPGALRAATKLLDEAPTPLERTRPLLAALKPAVPSVLQVTRALAPNLVPLRRAFEDLDPLLNSVAVHACDVANFGDNWRSVLGYGAPSARALPGGEGGHFNQLRVNVVAGPESVSSLLPGIAKPFLDNTEIVQAPCTHSPGTVYTPLGLFTPPAPARSRR